MFARKILINDEVWRYWLGSRRITIWSPDKRKHVASLCDVAGPSLDFDWYKRSSEFKSWFVRRYIERYLVNRTEGMEIVEGIEGFWNYHIAKTNADALCGKKRKHLMLTNVSFNAWGWKSDHISESYCEECDASARKLGVLPAVEEEV